MANVVLFIFALAGGLAAQDGSDIRYYRPAEMHESCIGKTVQIDFYRRSFAGRRPDVDETPLDKILLNINGRPIEFLEHREDDGFNNIFSRQYLESVDKKVRITEFKVLKIDDESITVLARLTVEPFSYEFKFAKKDIAEVLVRSKQ